MKVAFYHYKMSREIFTDAEIYTRSYEEALKHNECILNRIKTFKKELQDVKTNLELHPKHLFQNVLVPIGTKAFMKGKLVHTNEVTINVGDRWFIKKSAAGALQTCDRMIERCDKNLAEYEKEMNLLSSNLEVPNDYQVFAGDDVQEIIEPYDDETEKQWREKHRENVRMYKLQLAASRESEDNLFLKLDQLEELEQEDDLDDLDSDNGEITEEEYDELIDKSIQMNQEITKSIAVEDEVDIIYFKHTEKRSQNNFMSDHEQQNSHDIITPSDIYRKFFHKILETNKTTTKRVVFSDENVIHNINETDEIQKFDFKTEDNSYDGHKIDKVQKSILKVRRNDAITIPSLTDDSPEVFGNIIEKTPTVIPQANNHNRPISKFKKSKLKSRTSQS